MEFVWIALIAGAGYVLIAAGYRLWLSLRELSRQGQQLRAKVADFSAADPAVVPAKPVFEEDLPRLLAERAKLLRDKEHRKQERRRRLISRISALDLKR